MVIGLMIGISNELSEHRGIFYDGEVIISSVLLPLKNTDSIKLGKLYYLSTNRLKNVLDLMYYFETTDQFGTDRKAFGLLTNGNFFSLCVVNDVIIIHIETSLPKLYDSVLNSNEYLTRKLRLF
jgi:hypothetical protein